MVHRHALCQCHDHAPWNAPWDQSVKWFDYSRIASISIGLIELAPERPATCVVRSMRFLSENVSPVNHLSIQSPSGKCSFAVQLERDHYLQISPDGTARIFDRNWHYLADTLLSGDVPESPSGKSTWVFNADGVPGTWINVRTCFSDRSEILTVDSTEDRSE